MSSQLYVEPGREISSNVVRAANVFGSQAKLADFIGCSSDSISLWKLEKRWIPFNVIKKLALVTRTDFEDLIDKRKMRGQNAGSSLDDGSLTFNVEMTSRKARIIGWIITDGNLHSRRNRIVVVQKHRAVLERLALDFQREFQMHPSHFGIYRLGDSWRLMVASAPLKRMLSLYYGIPVGQKYSKVMVPPSLFEANRLIKLSFLIAVIEGDGSFTFTTIRDKKYPQISLQAKNKIFIFQLRKMLNDLGFHPAKCNSRARGHFGFALKRKEEVIKFIREGLPLMIHDVKKKKAVKLLNRSA